MKLSIITAYDGSTDQYLEAQLKNLNQQQVDDFELILVTKVPVSVDVNDYQFPITIEQVAKSNMAQAYNRGLELATGDYVLFMGVDDYLLPLAIRQWFAVIAQHAEKVIDVGRMRTDLTLAQLLTQPSLLKATFNTTSNGNDLSDEESSEDLPGQRTVGVLTETEDQSDWDNDPIMMQLLALNEQGYHIIQNKRKYTQLSARLALEGFLFQRDYLASLAQSFDETMRYFFNVTYVFKTLVNTRYLVTIDQPTYFKYVRSDGAKKSLNQQRTVPLLTEHITAYQQALQETQNDVALLGMQKYVLRHIGDGILRRLYETPMNRADQRRIMDETVALEAMVPLDVRRHTRHSGKWVMRFARQKQYGLATLINRLRFRLQRRREDTDND